MAQGLNLQLAAALSERTPYWLLYAFQVRFVSSRKVQLLLDYYFIDVSHVPHRTSKAPKPESHMLVI